MPWARLWNRSLPACAIPSCSDDVLVIGKCGTAVAAIVYGARHASCMVRVDAAPLLSLLYDMKIRPRAVQQ